MRAGTLRHTVQLQRKSFTQDAVTGEMVVEWVTFKEVSAAIEPLSAREFLQSRTEQSSTTARIVIRYLPGLTADMRILHGSTIYNPQGFLADKKSGREYLTIPCSEGVNDG